MHRTNRTWKQMAEVLQVSPPAMAQWKSGRTKPSKKTVFRICEAEKQSGIAPPELPVFPTDKPAVVRENSTPKKNVYISSEARDAAISEAIARAITALQDVQRLLDNRQDSHAKRGRYDR